MKLQSQTGTSLAVTLLGRGDFTTTETQKFIFKLQHKLKFARWSPKMVKVGLCDVPPPGHPLAMLYLQNSTAMSLLYSNILENFNKLHKRKVVSIDIVFSQLHTFFLGSFASLY